MKHLLVEATEEDLVEAREIALEGVADIPSQFKPSQTDSDKSAESPKIGSEFPNAESSATSSPDVPENVVTTAPATSREVQRSTLPAKAGVRSGPGTSKFFRRPNERRRRQGGAASAAAE